MRCKCGWELPDTFVGTCPACKHRHYRLKEREKFRKRRAGGQEELDSWKRLLALQPARTLTEEEWLATCQHFGKCAFCMEDEIAARVYFIPFEEGGPYAVWNMLPACEFCATELKLQLNPFVRLSYKRNSNYNSKTNNPRKRGNLQAIVAFLKGRMEVGE